MPLANGGRGRYQAGRYPGVRPRAGGETAVALVGGPWSALGFIVLDMTNRKALVTALAVGVLGGGCGGFSASRSVSPLDFILPGIMEHTPSAPSGLRPTNAPPVLAPGPGVELPVLARVVHNRSQS